MIRRMCRSKIHRAWVTESRVDYEGSIAIDEDLMKAANLAEHEMVLVANMANGHRFETYVIKGQPGSGVIGLNGAAAHLGKPGDDVIVMAMGLIDEQDLPTFEPTFVKVDKKNKIKSVSNALPNDN
jgi:aspartate 1-decarboxylase